MNELARKDLFTCLGIWLALELVSFGLLPAIGLSASTVKTDTWFILSLPLGIGGAVLMASSTQLSSEIYAHQDSHRASHNPIQPIFFSVLESLTSWIGLLGIGFPLLILSAVICVELFQRIQGE